jgi:hypothetical protein
MSKVARPRVDLDGIALREPRSSGPAIVILRYRTTSGLVFLMPESADFVVSWEHLDEVVVDLKSGLVRVSFDPTYAAEQNWLRGARVLEGRWMDRIQLDKRASES